MEEKKDLSKHRISPKRIEDEKQKLRRSEGQRNLLAESRRHLIVDPEALPPHLIHNRTKQLATDQCMVAESLITFPNKATLNVVTKLADGVNSIMNRLNHTGDEKGDLEKDEILISICNRLMADGGTGRIKGYNATLKALVAMREKKPIPDDYVKEVQSLAEACREKMKQITTNARIPAKDPKEGMGEEEKKGAVARQGLLAFMGDLGCLLPKTTDFGPAYKGPICNAKLIYDSYIAGACDAQRTLRGESVPASNEEVSNFEQDVATAKAATAAKGGVLSATMHTEAKQEERAPVDWDPQERLGLHNTAPLIVEIFKRAIPGYEPVLFNVSWPKFGMPRKLPEDLAEPVTGHISGTIGEMIFITALLCGIDPKTITRECPWGNATEEQRVIFASLASAILIRNGFHSAVEVFQAVSTYTTQATYGSLGPKAVEDMKKHAFALREYEVTMRNVKGGPPRSYHSVEGYQLSKEELKLSPKDLMNKAQSLENAATKSVDMISLLQGGGTLATIEVCNMMANCSSNPKFLHPLYSLDTRVERLALLGNTPELEKARELLESLDELDEDDPSYEERFEAVEAALLAAEEAADRKEEEAVKAKGPAAGFFKKEEDVKVKGQQPQEKTTGGPKQQ